MKPVRFLIVDDYPLIRVGLRTALQSAFPGSTAHEVGSLEDALKRLAETSYDVVILDLTLSDSTGPATHQAVRDQCPDVAIVIVTGSADDLTAETCRRIGAAAVRDRQARTGAHSR
jgi:DNA-binding NarL/FixJ family response regulator